MLGHQLHSFKGMDSESNGYWNGKTTSVGQQSSPPRPYPGNQQKYVQVTTGDITPLASAIPLRHIHIDGFQHHPAKLV